MVPDKFNMVDMEGIDLIESQGVEIPGLYEKLVESIAQCRYQCLYNWKFDGILIPPTYVEMETHEDGVWINEGVMVDEENVVHIYSIEPEPPAPEVQPLTVTENGEYYTPVGVDGYNPVVVNVPPEEPSLQNITVTENGTYTPDSGYDGFSEVIVSVPSSGSSPIPYYAKETNYDKFIDSSGRWDPSGYSGTTAIFFNVVPNTRYILYLGNVQSQRVRAASYNIDVHDYEGSNRVSGQSLVDVSPVSAYQCFSILPTNQYLAVCGSSSLDAYLIEEVFN